MSPAAAPTQQFNVQYMLGELMERTKPLPQLTQDVSALKVEVGILNKKFDAHDSEMRRLRGATSKTRRALAFAKGQWKTAAGIAVIVADHYFKRGH